MPIQEKIAELESRIAALEKVAKVTTVTTTTTQRAIMNLEPELSGIWKSVDTLFVKIFSS